MDTALAISGDSLGMQYGAELSHMRLVRARVKACAASFKQAACRDITLEEAAIAASGQRAAAIQTEYKERWLSTDGKSYIRGILQNGSKLEGAQT